MPAAILFARFRRCYPEAVWRSREYPTRGHVIPFGLFWIYYGAMRSLHALERVQVARGTAHAIALSFAKKEGGLPDALRDDLKDAYLLDRG